MTSASHIGMTEHFIYSMSSAFIHHFALTTLIMKIGLTYGITSVLTVETDIMNSIAVSQTLNITMRTKRE